MADAPERILDLRDDGLGLRAVVVLDSTARGPAFGGIRRASYPDLAAARADALALARAMTTKCALAGLAAGGAKTVVIDDGNPSRNWPAIYAAIGDAVERLGGAYVCGPDVGTGPAELAVVRTRTRHCNPASNDASAATAAGVLAAMRAIWPALGGAAGCRAVVQGLGGVGSIVARELGALGLEVIACDPHPAATERARSWGFATTDDPFAVECDVLVPCAMGGVIDPARAHALRCRAVCGSANNQLVGDADVVLLDRGIVHVPDVVSSAGAVIEGVLVVRHGDTPEVRRRVRDTIAAIETTSARLLAAAAADHRSPSRLADEWARVVTERS